MTAPSATRLSLNRHQPSHTRVKKFSCTQCNKVFSLSGDLNRHKVLHTGVKKFTCNQLVRQSYSCASPCSNGTVARGGYPSSNQCDQVFSLSCNLNRHKLLHTGEKQFACNQCDKTFFFSWPSKLKAHKLSHMGVGQFTCNQVLSRLSNLKAHKLSHIGLSQFACDQCNKAFSLSGNLNRHKLLHYTLR